MFGLMLTALPFLFPSTLVWNEYVANGFIPIEALYISSSPVTTLLASALAGVVASLALHALRLRRIPLGLRVAAVQSAQLVALLYVIAVLLGCPVHSPEALAWAVYVALCFGLYECVTLSHMQQRLRESTVHPQALRDAAQSPLAWALLWSWIGAWAIPLDWDRPWQPFPISSALLSSLMAPVCLALARTMNHG